MSIPKQILAVMVWMEAARKRNAQTLQVLTGVEASIDLSEQDSRDVLNAAPKNQLENVVLLLLYHTEALPEEEELLYRLTLDHT